MMRFSVKLKPGLTFGPEVGLPAIAAWPAIGTLAPLDGGMENLVGVPVARSDIARDLAGILPSAAGADEPAARPLV